jgi:hypothetical protein
VKRLVAIALLGAATAAQARHWVPVATRPDFDMTGLYVDRDSVKGPFTRKTAWEKFLNSYGEQRLSLVEIDCAKNRWRAVKTVLLSPSGTPLKRSNSPGTNSEPIKADPLQSSAKALVCKLPKHKHDAGKRR